jgi:crotonobetainyl-CoA:carnitine CoA-transferase CaiB-like acyl-CoA transferase
VLALPWRHRITTEDGPLGGANPFYRLYEAERGWIALAALEQRFRERVTSALDIDEVSVEAFARVFRTRPADEWEQWAAELDIPLAAVR